MSSKGLIIILDGLGDRPNSDLGGRTPLEAADTPAFDGLADRGSVGLVHPLFPWVPVGTQTGIGLLTGLARSDVPLLRRGPVEAAGVGLDINEGDIAVRCNIATLERTGKAYNLIDRRAGRRLDGVEELLSELSGVELTSGVRLQLKHATQHRVVALLQGKDLAETVTETDPGAGRGHLGVQPSRPLDGSSGSARTARALNELVSRSFEVFDEHPLNALRVQSGLLKANGLIARGVGSLFRARNLLVHLGVKTAVVTGERTVVGLGRIFGFDVHTDSTMTADVLTNVEHKVRIAAEALETNELVYLHFKGSDIAAHDRDGRSKRDFIARVDAAVAELDLDGLVVGVTGDHSTDSSSGRHTGDPVPSIVSGPGCRLDGVDQFDEHSASHGGLGHLTATGFLCACLDLMGRLRNHKPGQELFFQ